MKSLLSVPALLAALIATGCQAPTDPPVTPVNTNVEQTLTRNYTELPSRQSIWANGTEDSLDKTRSLKVSLTLPAAARVYFLYSNVANNTSSQNLGDVSENRGLFTIPRPLKQAPASPEPRLELSGLQNLHPRNGSSARALAANDIPKSPALGNKAHFIDSSWSGEPSEANRHAMTLRVKQVDAEAKRTLYIWVVDDCYQGANADLGTRFKVTTAMAQALADKFLKPASTNDIYGLVTGMLGAEWSDAGSAPVSKSGVSYDGQLIDGLGQIHIVIGDLNPMDDPTKRRFGGGLEGYFHGWNNILGQGSNERVLFAVDANSLGNPDGDGVRNEGAPDDLANWSLQTSYYPNDIVATLAHEFQHMIQFYQKPVLNTLDFEADAWINEMASMAVEDLVADQVGFSGPRGLAPNDYSAGDVSTYLVTGGRLPLFNGVHSQVPLQYWGSGLDTLVNYANAYAFGAWLTRNYGGPHFWRDLVQSRGTDIQAVVDAVNAHLSEGEPEQTYRSLVRNWGLAILYGSQTPIVPYVAPLTYQAASGGPFEFPISAAAGGTRTITFKTGSINLYHYPQVVLDADYNQQFVTDAHGYALTGPSAWGIPPTAQNTLAAGATWISYIGTGTGEWNRTAILPPGVVLTVLVNRP